MDDDLEDEDLDIELIVERQESEVLDESAKNYQF